MITVEQATHIIQSQARDYGIEVVPFEQSAGRVLAEDIFADRDMPPFNRVTMDGICINYAAFADGIRSFHITGTQAAGDKPLTITQNDHCIEIMTGAVLPDALDTVIRYEDVLITGTFAEVILEKVKPGQNIHFKGQDKQQGAIIADKNQIISPAIISIFASVGKMHVLVKRIPRVVIISSGDELVEVNETPAPHQIRRSNNYTVKAVLKRKGVAADMLHIPDDAVITRAEIAKCLNSYDVILLSGGISMGKFDYIPEALEKVGVAHLFYKVKQRPGKPFWFGSNEAGILVFAFPGSPVATFMCLHRYFLPWLNATLGLPEQLAMYAALEQDFLFEPDLQYFLQVKINYTKNASITATPLVGNGSGDFANLADTDAFIELPAGRGVFQAGETFRAWPFRH